MSERLNRIPVREVVTAPVFHTEPRQLCSIYPHCECEADCIGGQSRRRAKRIALGLAIAAVLIAAGVILASLKRLNWIFFAAMTASVSFEAWLVHLVLA